MSIIPVIHHIISSITPISTSHGVGKKRVLCSQSTFTSPITQLAITELKAGDQLEAHTHPTMDEHFIILEGECEIIVDDKSYHCEKDTYLLIPAGCEHSLRAMTDVRMITIGIEVKR